MARIRLYANTVVSCSRSLHRLRIWLRCLALVLSPHEGFKCSPARNCVPRRTIWLLPNVSVCAGDLLAGEVLLADASTCAVRKLAKRSRWPRAND
jgi:hypothetical protein